VTLHILRILTKLKPESLSVTFEHNINKVENKSSHIFCSKKIRIKMTFVISNANFFWIKLIVQNLLLFVPNFRQDINVIKCDCFMQITTKNDECSNRKKISKR